MNTAQQIALLRARYAAKSAPERARQVLVAAGFPWRLAGCFVLDHRRREARAEIRRPAP